MYHIHRTCNQIAISGFRTTEISVRRTSDYEKLVVRQALYGIHPTLTWVIAHGRIRPLCPHSSSGPGRGPLKAETGVRFPYGGTTRTARVYTRAVFIFIEFQSEGEMRDLEISAATNNNTGKSKPSKFWRASRDKF